MYYPGVFIRPDCFDIYLRSFVRQAYGRDTAAFAHDVRESESDIIKMMTGDLRPSVAVLRAMHRDPEYILAGYRYKPPKPSDFSDHVPSGKNN